MMLALLAFVSVLRQAPSEPLLISRAQLITKIVGWREAQLSVGQHFWWSPTQIFVYLEDDKRAIFDIQTKKLSPIQIHKDVFDGDISPDRTKAIMQDQKNDIVSRRVSDPLGAKDFGSWTTKIKEPRQYRSADYGHSGPEAIWSQDGRTIFEIDYWYEGGKFWAKTSQRSLDGLSAVRTYPLATIARGSAISVYDGKALLQPYQFGSGKQFWLREWDLETPGKNVKKWSILAPKGQYILEYRHSPDFKHAFWIMGRPSSKQMTDNGYPHTDVSLWISGLHGENLSEVGVIPFGTKKQGDLMDHYQNFGEIQWNPDNKNVSFVYYRNLYMVQVVK